MDIKIKNKKQGPGMIALEECYIDALENMIFEFMIMLDTNKLSIEKGVRFEIKRYPDRAVEDSIEYIITSKE
jgi:hypothetical protein